MYISQAVVSETVWENSEFSLNVGVININGFMASNKVYECPEHFLTAVHELQPMIWDDKQEHRIWEFDW